MPGVLLFQFVNFGNETGEGHENTGVELKPVVVVLSVGSSHEMLNLPIVSLFLPRTGIVFEELVDIEP
jgi:hypothetical protein